MSWLSRLLDSRVTGLLGVYVFTSLDNAHLVALGENYFFHQLFFEWFWIYRRNKEKHRAPSCPWTRYQTELLTVACGSHRNYSLHVTVYGFDKCSDMLPTPHIIQVGPQP